MKYLAYILLFLLILIESSITTLPLVLIFLLLFTTFTKSEEVFFMAFVSGIIIDILTLRSFGATSIFLLAILFLVLLYDRKFEIKSLYFVTLSTLVASVIYLLIFRSSYILSQALICVILSFVFFTLVKNITNPKIKAYSAKQNS